MNQSPSTKLPIRVKLAYTIGYFGKNSLILLNTYFLLYFYTNVIQIPAAAATVILFIARIWDAINDPMMGVIVDKTKSKLGKCRFYLKYFSIPAGVIVALSYTCPELSTNGKILWVGITYILQGMATTIITVPLNALLARLTDNRAERVSIGQFNAVSSSLSNVLVPSITLPLVAVFGGNNTQKGFSILAVCIGVLFIISMLITYVGTNGYEETDENNDIVESHQEKLPISKMLKVALQNKYCTITCLAYVFSLLASSIMGASIVYYFQYNLKNTDLMKVYSSTITFGSIFSIFFMIVLYKKLGNAKSCIFGCILTLIGCLLRLITKDSIFIIIVISWILIGFGSGILGNHVFQCIMDSITYGKQKNNINSQGVIMSLFTFAQKFGQAIGGVIAAALLSALSFNPNLAEQSKAILNLFFAENITFPLIMCIFSILCFAYISKLESEILAIENKIKQQAK